MRQVPASLQVSPRAGPPDAVIRKGRHVSGSNSGRRTVDGRVVARRWLRRDVRVRNHTSMSDKGLTRIVVVTILVGCSSVVAAQGQDASWEPTPTVDGHPDLQGVWLNNVATPVERPPALAGRARLTEEELAGLRERAERIFENGRSAFAIPESAFTAALADIETYEAASTSSSIGMVDLHFVDRTSLVVEPTDGRIPALSPGAEQRRGAVDRGWREKTGPEDFSSIHRCITTGVPRLGGNFGAGPYTYYQIFQSRDHVVIMSEAFHDARIIPLDGRPALSEDIRQWNGDSRGHWDGETLVVETRNFSSDSYFRGAADGLRVVERFTRTDADVLTYSLTFSDSTTWAGTWAAETSLQRRDQDIYEFACHEGNHSLVGMLRTARLEDASGR